MAYYDVTGGERGNNYFGSIKAGETKILHVGFVRQFIFQSVLLTEERIILLDSINVPRH